MVELSIIIISYNTVKILEDCLRSIYSHPPQQKFEIIVVDNDSQDGSVAMVQSRFVEVRVIANTTNRGFAAANNQGLEVAQGRYSLLLNSDTLILDDVLSKSLCYMKDNEQVGMMGCRVLNADRSMQETCFMWPSLLNIMLLSSGLGLFFPESEFVKRERMRGWERDSYREVDAITGCYLLVSMDAVEKVGILDEDFFFYGEETDWCRRFSDAGYRVCFAPVGEIIHLGGASGEAGHYSRKLLLSQALVRLQRKHNGFLCGAFAWLLLLLECAVKGIGFACMMIFCKRFTRDCKQNIGALMHFGQAWAKRGRRSRKRVLAVASSGGHWMELCRLRGAFKKYEMEYVSTQQDIRGDVIGSRFHLVMDVNRWKKWQIPSAVFQMFCLLWRQRPDVVISTGAMPGLLAIIWGRIFGAKTIWIDSLANCNELSLSGRIAGKFATLWLTQWEHLADSKIGLEYAGKVVE